MAITPIINNKANILDASVDFNLLASVLGNLDSVSAAKLGELATANLVEMTNDLAKGNYLGNRKLDIDLSLNIGSNGLSIYYQQVDIVSSDGVRVSHPFYASGTTTIAETTSPSQILTHIQDAITAYNLAEPNATLHILNTEFQLLNEVDVTKPTVIRIIDVDGKASGIARIELVRNVSGVVDSYFWELTTSSLQTLANRIGDLLALGASIPDIVALASKQIEIENLYANRGALFSNADSLYTEMSKLVTLYNNITSLVAINASLANVNAVGADLTNIDAIAPHVLNIDTTASSISDVVTVSSNIAKVSTVSADITNIDNVATQIVPNLTTILDVSNQAAAASQSAVSASASATTATDQATLATTKNQEIKAISVANTTTGAAGTLANVVYDNVNNTFTFVVPKGDKGSKGDPFTVNSLGHTADKALYDTQATGFSFLDLDTSLIYFKNSSTSGDWTAGVPFGKGDTGATGATGNGVVSITFTSTTDISSTPAQSGATDTYTITYTDTTTSTFSVHNGLDSAVLSVAGKTGSIVLTKTDVGLANVDNTADLLKPISTATQTALDLKANTASVTGTLLTGVII